VVYGQKGKPNAASNLLLLSNTKKWKTALLEHFKLICSLIINGCTDRQSMHTGTFIGQLVTYLPNETLITANYNHTIVSAI